MAIPAIKALRSLDPLGRLDVLVGSSSDDAGAAQIMGFLRERGIISNLYVDRCDDVSVEYDLAIMSIPFDGRWKNGNHFRAKAVVDGRTRPDPATTGLVSWKKHETQYQLDLVQAIAGRFFSCDEKDIRTFDSSFFPTKSFPDMRNFYLGVGYKKDLAGFWKIKHWGNENYSNLLKLLFRNHLCDRVYVTGDSADFTASIAPIMRNVNDNRLVYIGAVGGVALTQSFEVISRCGTYIGNDTGMMHVAASMDLSVVAPFFLENSIVKSRPICSRASVINGVGRHVSPEEFLENVRRVNGKT